MISGFTIQSSTRTSVYFFLMLSGSTLLRHLAQFYCAIYTHIRIIWKYLIAMEILNLF